MTLIFPGERLLGQMDSASVIALGHELRMLIEDMEREAAPLFRALRTWWKWYEATPRDKEKTFPFVGASNVVVPLIGVVCDALTSRSLSQATAAAPTYWTTKTENEARTLVARNMSRWINWQADGNSFSLKHVLAEWLLETHVAGRGVAALNWHRDARPMFVGRTPIGGTPRISRQVVSFKRGPLVEHVPRENLLWDTRHRVGDAPAVVRRYEWTWPQLRDLAKLDEAWDRKAVEEVRRHPGVGGSETSRVQQAKNELDLRDPIDLELHDVREVWVDWSMLGSRFEVPGEEKWGGQQVPIVAHLHMTSGKLLRLVGMPYLLPYKPFVDFKFRAGRGVAKRLEMAQSIATTAINQELDAGTRRNALWGKTTNARLNRQPIDPSKWLLVDTMGDAEAFVFTNQTASSLALLNAIQVMTERWMGSSDPLLGRETRSGGHPAPATSTLALLEQVNTMNAGTDVVLQQELSRLGEAIAVLNQQFEDNSDGMLERVLGPGDAASVGEYLFPEEPIPGNYWFSVAALSRTENPDAVQRRTLMTAQAYQNYGTLVAQGAMILENPQAGPAVKKTWVQLMQGYGELLSRFLDASNVDDVERFVVDFQAIAREAAAAAQAGALGGAGGPAGGGGGAVTGAGSAVGTGNGAARGAGVFAPGGGLLQ